MDGRLGRPQDLGSGRPQDVSSGRPRDGQIGSLGDVLGMLEGEVLRTSWGPIFAGWELKINNLVTAFDSKKYLYLSIASLYSLFVLCSFQYTDLSSPLLSFANKVTAETYNLIS